MSTRLQAARKDRGWSQTKLISLMRARARAGGDELPSDDNLKTMLSRWENGHVAPNALYSRLLREVTGLTDVELGFTRPPDDPITPPVHTAHDELVAGLEIARHIDVEHVAALQAQTDAFRRLDRPLGAPRLLEQVRGHIAGTQHLLTHSLLGAQRRPLARVLADAAALAGWQALDVGAPAQSWAHFETAKAAGREAEDACLLAHATGEQAYVLLELGRVGDAVELVRHAAERGSRLPRDMRAWLKAAEAEMLAASGNDLASLRAIEKASTLLAPEPAGVLPYLAIEEVHLTRWHGNVLARIGHKDATVHLTRALDAMDPTFRRATAGLHCDLALAASARGERHLALEHAAQARKIAQEIGSVRQANRVAALRFPG